MPTISFVSSKGGVGKTTASLLLATQFARKGAEVTFTESDWYTQVRGRFNMIVANPPYVAEDDPHLPSLRHEPKRALVSGPTGLDALNRIITEAPEHLVSCGWLLVEHGFAQGSAVAAQCVNAGFTEIECVRDLAGRDRVTLGQLASRRGPQT